MKRSNSERDLGQDKGEGGVVSENGEKKLKSMEQSDQGVTGLSSTTSGRDVQVQMVVEGHSGPPEVPHMAQSSSVLVSGDKMDQKLADEIPAAPHSSPCTYVSLSELGFPSQHRAKKCGYPFCHVARSNVKERKQSKRTAYKFCLECNIHLKVIPRFFCDDTTDKEGTKKAMLAAVIPICAYCREVHSRQVAMENANANNSNNGNNDIENSAKEQGFNV